MDAEKDKTISEVSETDQKRGLRYPSDCFINREISWLEFNARVLEEALDKDTPLLERLKFLAIFSSNLDEFFMVRVAGLKKLIDENLEDLYKADELTSQQVVEKLRARTLELVQQQYDCLSKEVLPQLEASNVKILKYNDLPKLEKDKLGIYFVEQIQPVLTPLAIDPAHPFPWLQNCTIYLMVTYKDITDTDGIGLPPMGLIEVPKILSRLIPVDVGGDTDAFILLEDLIHHHLNSLFLGMEIENSFPLRVTRNLDYNLLESEVVDLIKAVQKEVSVTGGRPAVRLEVTPELPKQLLSELIRLLYLSDDDVYFIPGPMDLKGFFGLGKLPRSDLKDIPFNPRLPSRLATRTDIFSLIASEDILVHHPYESFSAVIEFINAAASDPDVLAIKKTFYRESSKSPIIDALINAAELGKQVTAVIELKARFDEKANIVWARRLEDAGVHVVFGFVGFKTHAKATLVVRREGKKLVKYVHLATGNYNADTARLYTDIGLFTVDHNIALDVTNMFNLITGFNILTGEKRLRLKKSLPTFNELAVAPYSLRETVLELIDREIQFQNETGKGRIVAKMNSLVDRRILERLYDASKAGVKIKLIIRGICCLKPGVPGLSENIEVISIVDRFLEHSRVFYFRAGGEKEVYVSSADWMLRNMIRRVEIMFPVKNPRLKKRLINEILDICLNDNVKARRMLPDGTYVRREIQEGESRLRSQDKFIELARKSGIKSIPYEKAIKKRLAKMRRPSEKGASSKKS